MATVFTLLRKSIVAYGLPAMAAVGVHGAVVAGVWAARHGDTQPPKVLNSFEMVELPSSAAVVERVAYEPEPVDEPVVKPQDVVPPLPEPEPEPVALPQPKPKPIRKMPEQPKLKVQEKPVAPPQPKSAVVSEAAAPAPAQAYVAPRQHAAYLDNPKPAYPTVARKGGMEGRVVLRVQVRRDGTVSGVEVAQSTGYSVLDRAARSAVVHWRFAPATQGGVAVEGEVLVPFDFRLTAG